MVVLTILVIITLCASIASVIVAGVVYLQIKELDEKYNVLVQHYYEPVKNVAYTSKEDKPEEDKPEEDKRYPQTPFDIINDMLEGKVTLEDETKRTVE